MRDLKLFLHLSGKTNVSWLPIFVDNKCWKVSRRQQIIFVSSAKTTSSQSISLYLWTKNIKLKEIQFFSLRIYWASFTTYLKAKKVRKKSVNEIKNWKKKICFSFLSSFFFSNNITLRAHFQYFLEVFLFPLYFLFSFFFSSFDQQRG